MASDDFSSNPYQLSVYQIQNVYPYDIRRERNLQLKIKSITFNYYC